MAETTNIRREISYKSLDDVQWEMKITFDNKMIVTVDEEIVTFTIKDKITKIEHSTEYVFLYFENKDFYQIKFEYDKFLVCDLFDKKGEHKGDIINYVFGE